MSDLQNYPNHASFGDEDDDWKWPHEMTRAELLAELGGERVGMVRTHVAGYGFGWFVPDVDPNPDGLRRRVWIVKE